MIEKYITIRARNKIQPYHWHDLMELNLVLAGEMNVVLNNRNIHLAAGKLLLINRDDVHCIESESADLLYLQIHLNMEQFNQYLPEIWTVYFTCGPDSTDAVSMELKAEIRQHMADIYYQVKGRDDADINYERNVIYQCLEILNDLNFAFQYSQEGASSLPKDERSSRLWQAFDYMYDHSTRKLSLQEVADHVYLSGPYLSAMLKKYMGRGFEEMLSFIRVEQSIRYLLNTDMSITDIAYECGFSAPRYFARSFYATYQCTPKEWRERNQTFFHMESEQVSEKILYDKELDIDAFENLLQEYTVHTALSPRSENITVDIGEPIAQSGSLIDRVRQISCSEEDAIRTFTVQRFLDCRRELGVTRFWIRRGSGKFDRIAAENMRQMGLEVQIGTEQAPDINAFILPNGIRTEQFYMQKALADVAEPYCCRGRNCVIYRNENGFNIILYHNGDGSFVCTLHITGLERDTDYLMYRSSPPRFHTKVDQVVQRLARQTVSESDVLENMYERDLIIEMARAEEPVIEHIELHSGQSVTITLQKATEQEKNGSQ